MKSVLDVSMQSVSKYMKNLRSGFLKVSSSLMDF